MIKQKITPIIFETYIARIENSIGAKLFRNFYAKVNGKKTDVMRNGELSCALFVSSILVLSQLLERVHGTVESTAKDLEKLGWKVIKKPKPGAVIVWEAMNFDEETHKHIGFYIGNNEAISNSAKLGYPVKHHITFENKRRIEAIFWNPKLK